MIPDPRASYTFANAAGSPSLPDVSQAGLLVGCAESGPAATPRPYGNAATVRTTFGECTMTRIAEGHFTDDANRRPLLMSRAATTTAGVLHLDLAGVVGGSSVATADGTVKPLAEYETIRVLALIGGTVGVPGIVLRLSLDNYQTYIDVNLGVATSVTFPLGGIKINFATGTLNANDEVRGWSEAPRWSTAQLEAAAADAIATTEYRFSLLCIAEHLLPADGSVVSGILNDLAADGIFAHAICTKRRRYHDSVVASFTGTFDDDPDTLTRATGSFITDGFKVGMSVTITGAVNSGNNGTFTRVASVTATVLTFSVNVAFAAELATTTLVVAASESQSDYDYNMKSEWSAFTDERVSFTKNQLRAAQPADNSQLDEQLHGGLFSRCISEPIESEPGQRRRVGNVGGTVSPRRLGRIYQDSVRIHPDMRLDGTGVVAPSTDIAVESAPDKRAGCFYVQCRTASPTSQIETIVMARLVNEWKSSVLTLEVDETLSAFPSDPGDPNKLSELGAQSIENLALAALRQRFAGKISNLDAIDPAEALVYVDRSSDLSTGGVSITGFIRTLFYARKFSNTIKIRRPGQVG